MKITREQAEWLMQEISKSATCLQPSNMPFGDLYWKASEIINIINQCTEPTLQYEGQVLYNGQDIESH